MVKHLLKVTDLTLSELWKVLKLTREIKASRKLGLALFPYLRGKRIALIFEKPSTRTRVSLAVAISDLGGYSLELEATKLQLSRGESLEDTVKVLSNYVDAIVARVRSHDTLNLMAKYAKVPVVNALSDLVHPLQAISDMYTIWEVFGRLRGINLAFVGDGGNNVCHSLLLSSSMLGVNFRIACPKEYRPKKSILREALSNAEESGAEILVTEDPYEAVKGADIIYTDVFVSMGFEEEKEERLKVFLPKYRVSKLLLESTGRRTLFMHCLPARRGEEVTSDIIDDTRISLIFQQAENRLYSAGAVLSILVGGGTSGIG